MLIERRGALAVIKSCVQDINKGKQELRINNRPLKILQCKLYYKFKYLAYHIIKHNTLFATWMRHVFVFLN